MPFRKAWKSFTRDAVDRSFASQELSEARSEDFVLYQLGFVFYEKQVRFQFVLNLGDAVVKVVRLCEERHAMERGPLQIRDRFLLGAE